MAVVTPIRIPWTEQPPLGTPVRRDGLGEGLIWFAHFGGGQPWEEVMGEAGVMNTNSVGIVQKDGIWCGEFADGQTNGGCDWPQHPDFHSGHSQLSCMAYAKRNNNTPNSTESPMAYAGTGTDAWDVSMATNGDLRFRFDIADIVQEATLAQSGWDYSEWNLMGGTWDTAATQYARVNKLKGTANDPDNGTNTAGTASGNNPRLGQRQNGATDSWYGWVAWGAVWKRALTDQEWNQIVDNPWILFEPRTLYLFGSINTNIIVPTGPLR